MPGTVWCPAHTVRVQCCGGGWIQTALRWWKSSWWGNGDTSREHTLMGGLCVEERDWVKNERYVVLRGPSLPFPFLPFPSIPSFPFPLHFICSLSPSLPLPPFVTGLGLQGSGKGWDGSSGRKMDQRRNIWQGQRWDKEWRQRGGDGRQEMKGVHSSCPYFSLGIEGGELVRWELGKQI